jgi:hypothetical protein
MTPVSEDFPEAIRTGLGKPLLRREHRVRTLASLAERFQENSDEAQWIEAHTVAGADICLDATTQRRLALMDELSTLIQTIAVAMRTKKSGPLH